jgi:hypothetical protein
MYFFAIFKKIKSHWVYDQTQGSRAVFSLLYGFLYCRTKIISKSDEN